VQYTHPADGAEVFSHLQRAFLLFSEIIERAQYGQYATDSTCARPQSAFILRDPPAQTRPLMYGEVPLGPFLSPLGPFFSYPHFAPLDPLSV